MISKIKLITPQSHLELYQHKIHLEALFKENLKYLHDDLDAPSIPLLLKNLESGIPDIVLALRDDEPSKGKILVGGSLSDIQPGHEAVIHGISLPEARRTGAIEQVAFFLMERAFVDYGVRRLKAIIPKTHQGARGFCLNHRFKPACTIQKGIQVQGQWHPVTHYVLTSNMYYQHTRRNLAHVLWKKEEIFEQSTQNNPHHQNRVQLTTGRRI